MSLTNFKNSLKILQLMFMQIVMFVDLYHAIDCRILSYKKIYKEPLTVNIYNSCNLNMNTFKYEYIPSKQTYSQLFSKMIKTCLNILLFCSVCLLSYLVGRQIWMRLIKSLFICALTLFSCFN